MKPKLPILANPPISSQRARENAAKQANAKSCTDEEGNFNGKSFAEIINPYTNLDYLQLLEQGGTLYSFRCCHDLSQYEAEMVDSIINLSAFDDEVTENYVPHFDSAKYKEEQKKKEDPPPPVAAASDSLFGFDILENAASADRIQEAAAQDEEVVPYSFLLARRACLLVGVDIQGLIGPDGPTLMSSAVYHKACEPTGTEVWTDYENMEPNNFRITKPIIPYVYDITVQFRVSSLTDPELLYKLGRHVGTRVDGGILLERTKRSKPPKEDATKKAKSVLLYTNLGEGVILVTHLTVVLQRGLPSPVERLINYLPNQFQKWGLGEACETTWKSNRYMRKVLPDASFLEEEDEEEFVDARDSMDG